MFILVFAVLGARLAQLTWPKTRNWRASAWPTAKPRFSVPLTDRNGVVLASQIYLTTLGANASEIQNGDVVAAQLNEILPNMNVQRARRLLAVTAIMSNWQEAYTLQKRAVLELGNPGLKLRAKPSVFIPADLLRRMSSGFCTDMQGLMGLERRLDEQRANVTHICNDPRHSRSTCGARKPVGGAWQIFGQGWGCHFDGRDQW